MLLPFEYTLAFKGHYNLSVLMSSTCHNLLYCSLDRNSIRLDGTCLLAKGLAVNKTLRTLYLRYNGLGDKGAHVLGTALTKNNTLTTLKLSANEIGDKGAVSLWKSLANNQSLTKLQLRNNQIGPDGAQGLDAMLKNNTTLTLLDLKGNKLGDKGASVIAKGLQDNATLRTLYLEGNSIKTDGANAIFDTLQTQNSLIRLFLQSNLIDDNAAKSLGAALAANTILTNLDLQDNQIGDAGAGYIAEGLETSALARLNLKGNLINDEGAGHLGRALEKNKALIFLSFDSSPSGRIFLSQGLQKNPDSALAFFQSTGNLSAQAQPMLQRNQARFRVRTCHDVPNMKASVYMLGRAAAGKLACLNAIRGLQLPEQLGSKVHIALHEAELHVRQQGFIPEPVPSESNGSRFVRLAKKYDARDGNDLEYKTSGKSQTRLLFVMGGCLVKNSDALRQKGGFELYSTIHCVCVYI
eukprot:m.295310 g.295310  ORF g.295310 m.295310 type:complete len:467 (+) comp15853_c2_seq7:231-1631(+)